MPFRDSAYRLRALVRHNLILITSDPGPIIGYIVMPILMITAFRPLYLISHGAVNGTLQVTAGAITLFSLITINMSGQALLNERSWRTWDRLRATPANGIELVLGKMIPFYLLLLGQQAALLLYSVLVFQLSADGLDAAVAIVVTWAAAVLAMGSLLASLVRTHGQLSMITDIGAITVTVLGGGLMPVQDLPGWMRPLAPFSPGYWAISGYKAAFTGRYGAPLLVPAGALLLVAAAATIVSVRTASRRGTSRQP